MYFMSVENGQSIKYKNKSIIMDNTKGQYIGRHYQTVFNNCQIHLEILC